MTSSISTVERATLAHGVTQLVADRHGIRVLHLKGAVSRVQFPERPGQSGDVDVLVEPGGVDDLVAGLEKVGWVVGYDSDDLDLANHAVVLSDEDFGVTIDVHRHFPGFGASDDEVFEALWADYVDIDLAGRRIAAPSRPGHAVVIGLHAARESATSRKAGEALQLWAAMDDPEQARARELAIATGAAPRLYLRMPLEFAGVPGVEDPGAYWRIRSGRPNGAALWLGRMRDARSPGEVAGLLVRALTPAPPALTEWTWQERLRRTPAHWAKGARQLGPALRMLRDR